MALYCLSMSLVVQLSQTSASLSVKQFSINMFLKKKSYNGFKCLIWILYRLCQTKININKTLTLMQLFHLLSSSNNILLFHWLGQKNLNRSASDITPFCKAKEDERRQNFARLVMMDSQALLPNPEPVECRICYMDLQPGDGVILRECLHCFCRLEINIIKTKDSKYATGTGIKNVCFLVVFFLVF